MLRPSLRAVGATTVVGCLLAGVAVITSSPAKADSAPGESVWITHDVWPFPEGPSKEKFERFESDGYTFRVSGDPHSVTFSSPPKELGESSYEVTFSAAEGEDLVVGQSYVYESGQADGAFLRDDGPRWCGANVSNAFRIDQLEFDPITEEVTNFAAVYHEHCDESVPDGTWQVTSVAFEPTDGALPPPPYGSLSGDPFTTLGLRFARSHVDYGRNAVAKGVLRTEAGDPLADQRITIQTSSGPSPWEGVAKGQTNAQGEYTVRFPAEKIAKFRAVFPGSDLGTTTASRTQRLYVHHLVKAHLSDSRVAVGEPLAIYGRVDPPDRRRPQVVRAQYKTNDGWRTFLDERIRKDGTYRMSIVTNAPGRYKLRMLCHERKEILSGISDPMTLRSR